MYTADFDCNNLNNQGVVVWDSFDHAEQRAKESIQHKADRTFIGPSDLLHLIKCYRLIDWECFAEHRETMEELGIVARREDTITPE